jgi:hypothetical protein
MVNEIYTFPNDTYTPDKLITWVVGIEPYTFVMILLAVWVIAFLVTKVYSTSRAWTFASFLCFILSIPLAGLGWLSYVYMYLLLLMTAIGIIWIRLGDSQW